MIQRYNEQGEVDGSGDFVKLEDMQELLDFLYQLMRSNADVAIDLLADKGESYLQQWGIL